MAVFSVSTGTCYFAGVEGTRRTQLSIKQGAGGRAAAVEGEGHEDELGGLFFPPDGRYLLFQGTIADRGVWIFSFPGSISDGIRSVSGRSTGVRGGSTSWTSVGRPASCRSRSVCE